MKQFNPNNFIDGKPECFGYFGYGTGFFNVMNNFNVWCDAGICPVANDCLQKHIQITDLSIDRNIEIIHAIYENVIIGIDYAKIFVSRH